MPRILKTFLLILAVIAAVSSCALAGFDDQFMEPDDIGQNKVPHFGLSRILFVPVIVGGLQEPDIERWRKFFENKLDAFTFRNFWHVNSLGSYDTEVVMVDPIRYDTCPLPENFKDCAVPRGDANALEPGVKFIRDLLKRVKAERGINFADLDINGPDRVADGWSDGIIVMTNADFPGVGFPVSLFKKFEIDGVRIGAVAIASLNEHEIIAVHEFGHLLGFGDLYHEHKRGQGLYLSLMGQYDDGLPLIDAYSRIKIGWADVVDIAPGTLPADIILPPAELSGRVVRIGGESEFMLLENRGPGEFFDKSFKSRGLAVYHVDESTRPLPGKWSFVQLLLNCFNCNEWHPLIMNEQPGGEFPIQNGKKIDPDTMLFRAGASLRSDYSNQSPLDPAAPLLNTNWYSGEPSDITIKVLDEPLAAPGLKVSVGWD